MNTTDYNNPAWLAQNCDESDPFEMACRVQIELLMAENETLRSRLLAMHDTMEASARAGAAHARHAADLEAQLESIGAGGVGPLLGHQRKPSGDNNLHHENRDSATTAAAGRNALRRAAHNALVALLHDDSKLWPRQERTEAITALRQALAAEPQATVKDPLTAQDEPVGMVLVPRHMNAAMRRVTDEEGWKWRDVLAAAEAITEDEHAEIGRSQQTAIPPGYRPVPVEQLEDLKQRVNTLAQLTQKRERHRFGIRVKQEIADMLAETTEAQAQQPLTTARIDELIEEGVFGCSPYELVRRLEEGRGVFKTKPLTDEQINALLLTHGRGDDGFRGFARAIEGAHGITGAT